MNDEKLNSSNTTDEDNNLSKDSKKRISYVSKDLKSMIDFVAKVYNQLGHTSYHSNKAIATIHGLSADSIKPQLSSTQQYKLLEIKHGTGYKITDHFQKLYLPRNENEKRNAVIESLKSAETYTQLFKDYEYHVVPLEGVKNHFIRSFGLKEDIAIKSAQIFIDNLKDFELLDSRGVLTSAMPSKPIIPDVNVETEELDKPLNNGDSDSPGLPAEIPARPRVEKLIFQSELDIHGKKTVPIYLIGSKQALFVYPDDITEEELELVKYQIDGVLMRIKLETKSKIKQSESN